MGHKRNSAKAVRRQLQAHVRLQLLKVRRSTWPHHPNHENGTDSCANETQQRELPGVRATPVNTPDAKGAIEHPSYEQGEADDG
jgi:hypothetical protein